MRATIKPLVSNALSRTRVAPSLLGQYALRVPPMRTYDRWSANVIARYGAKIGTPGWCPASLVHLRTGGARAVWNRYFGLRVQCSSQFSLQNNLHAAHFFPERILLRERTIRGASTAADLFGRAASQIARCNSPTGPNDINPRLAASGTAARIRSMPSETNVLWPPLAKILLSREGAVTQMLAARSALTVDEHPPIELARQVGQKVRRVETGWSPVPRDILVASAATRSYGTANGSRMRPTPSRQVEEEFGKQALPSAVAVDVKKITDEVMQRIDKRIVAARERMGKI